jgi:hypothetical protein
MMTFINDYQAIRINHAIFILHLGDGLEHANIDSPGPLFSSTPKIPIDFLSRLRNSVSLVFHCSTSCFRRTSINDGSFRSAIKEQAIIVLPEPGGAIKTPAFAWIEYQML